jgi:hypothetical protein
MIYWLAEILYNRRGYLSQSYNAIDVICNVELFLSQLQ